MPFFALVKSFSLNLSVFSSLETTFLDPCRELCALLGTIILSQHTQDLREMKILTWHIPFGRKSLDQTNTRIELSHDQRWRWIAIDARWFIYSPNNCLKSKFSQCIVKPIGLAIDSTNIPRYRCPQLIIDC